MSSIKSGTTIKEYQVFVKEVYGLSNDRYFSTQDMIANVERFLMRGMKGIRKGDKEKTKLNLLIALSWFASFMNQMHINIDEEVWQRFPYVCSYCGSCPCRCKEQKVKERKGVVSREEKRPKTLEEFQKMFGEIYPAQNRNLEKAGIHLTEEMGELSEAVLAYRSGRAAKDFKSLAEEGADFISCMFGVFNSLGASIAGELSLMYSLNCHICKKAPCECSFVNIVNFKS